MIKDQTKQNGENQIFFFLLGAKFVEFMEF